MRTGTCRTCSNTGDWHESGSVPPILMVTSCGSRPCDAKPSAKSRSARPGTVATGRLRPRYCNASSAAAWVVNDERVEQIWQCEGLKVPHKQPNRGTLWLADGSRMRLRPQHRRDVSSHDFVEDRNRHVLSDLAANPKGAVQITTPSGNIMQASSNLSEAGRRKRP